MCDSENLWVKINIFVDRIKSTVIYPNLSLNPHRLTRSNQILMFS